MARDILGARKRIRQQPEFTDRRKAETVKAGGQYIKRMPYIQPRHPLMQYVVTDAHEVELGRYFSLADAVRYGFNDELALKDVASMVKTGVRYRGIKIRKVPVSERRWRYGITVPVEKELLAAIRFMASARGTTPQTLLKRLAARYIKSNMALLPQELRTDRLL